MGNRNWARALALIVVGATVLSLAGDGREAGAVHAAGQQLADGLSGTVRGDGAFEGSEAARRTPEAEGAGTDRSECGDPSPSDALFDGPHEFRLDGDPDEVAVLAAHPESVALAPGRHEQWIDRLVLPTWGRGLYDRFVEGSDADGVDDFLIDDAALSPGAATSRLHDYVPGRVVTYRDQTYLVVAEIGPESSANALGDVVFAVAGCFEFDHPEVFWLNRTVRYATVGFATRPAVTRFLVLCLSNLGDGYRIRDGSYGSKESIERDIALRDRCVSRAMAEAVAGGAGPFEQVRCFNRWLTESNGYNSELRRLGRAPSDLVYRSITALKGRTGAAGPVCDGYAKAFKVLCDAAGIPCVFVRGLVDPGDPSSRHGWNEVCIGDRWYAVDVTWNDPVGDGSPSARSGREDEQYLLVGSGTTDAAGRAFASHHVETDDLFGEGSARLLNGPALSEVAYHAPGREPAPVYRLWNPSSGEHLFTTSLAEYRGLPGLGWRPEGVAWYGLRAAGVPVYRLANPYSGDHHYTADAAECDRLARLGWRREGIAWRAEDGRRIPVHRLYNPYEPGPGAHHLTTDATECRLLLRAGWTYEGIGCQGALR